MTTLSPSILLSRTKGNQITPCQGTPNDSQRSATALVGLVAIPGRGHAKHEVGGCAVRGNHGLGALVVRLEGKEPFLIEGVPIINAAPYEDFALTLPDKFQLFRCELDRPAYGYARTGANHGLRSEGVLFIKGDFIGTSVRRLNASLNPISRCLAIVSDNHSKVDVGAWPILSHPRLVNGYVGPQLFFGGFVSPANQITGRAPEEVSGSKQTNGGGRQDRGEESNRVFIGPVQEALTFFISLVLLGLIIDVAVSIIFS
ncbi:hypothetical protein, partial [Methylobacterium sp. Leaf456]|uniref:hypothetical protein n=1 Tax=Methylobacterium sp. Leaf456 TaxID=1736382 RepID=UPI000ABB43D8